MENQTNILTGVLKVKLKALSNEKGYQMLIKTIKDGD
jgi:hypothetical protein